MTSLCCYLSRSQLDELDQNAAVNKAGQVVGAFTPVADQVSTDSLAPYRFVRALWVYGVVGRGSSVAACQKCRPGGAVQRA